MDKRQLSESDICEKFIRPAMARVGWDTIEQIYAQFPLRAGWYNAHPYPPGVKNYNKTKPIRIEEIDAEKAWWGTEADGFVIRVENERAWKVSIDQIKAANYNLDQKNPHVGEVQDHNPEHLLADFQRLQGEALALRNELRGILAQSQSLDEHRLLS